MACRREGETAYGRGAKRPPPVYRRDVAVRRRRVDCSPRAASPLRRSRLRLDIDCVAIDDGDALVLSVTQRVTIHRGLIAIIGRVGSVHRIRIVIIDQVYRHTLHDVAPADIIIPSPAKSRGEADRDQLVAIRMSTPKIAPPPVTSMPEPATVIAVKMVRTNLTMSSPFAAGYLA